MPVTDAAQSQTDNCRHDLPGRRARTVKDLFLIAGLIIWCLPAILALAEQSWQTETGSLSPVVMALGLWTLWQTLRTSQTSRSQVPAGLAILAIMLLLPLHLAGAILDMSALLGLTAWAGLCVVFTASQGLARTKEAAFALLFIGLIIPLPYSLSLPMTLRLREAIADWATDVAWLAGMDVALDRDTIIIGGYELAVDAACSGLNSTLSLTAIGLLYAYWSRNHGWHRMAIICCLSIPIALAANILRVVFLMLLVTWTGLDVLSSYLHPLSGIVSFMAAMMLLWSCDRLLDQLGLYARPWIAREV